MDFYIGIDGGGTGSRLVAIDAGKNMLASVEGGSTNIAAVGREVVSSNIKALVEQLGYGLADCNGLCIGSAGATVGDNRRILEEIFRELGYSGKVLISNDGELMLLAETGGEPGAILISGTGSVAYAIDLAGTRHRAGGWGHIIDDGGSGYRIGMDAIQAVQKAFDGRGAATMLTQMIDVDMSYIYSPTFHKAEIAKLAVVVCTAAEQGDSVALAIERRAAIELVELATAVITRAGLVEHEHKLVLSGSVILRNANIRSIFEDEMRRRFNNIRITEPSKSPAFGAALLARGDFP